MVNFLTIETTSIFPLLVFHILIVIYQPPSRVELIYHTSYATLELALFTTPPYSEYTILLKTHLI